MKRYLSLLLLLSAHAFAGPVECLKAAEEKGLEKNEGLVLCTGSYTLPAGVPVECFIEFKKQFAGTAVQDLGLGHCSGISFSYVRNFRCIHQCLENFSESPDDQPGCAHFCRGRDD